MLIDGPKYEAEDNKKTDNAVFDIDTEDTSDLEAYLDSLQD